MKYFVNRQNPLGDIEQKELDRLFKLICDYYDETWLKESVGQHRLQKLWKRRDALSTCELYTLAYSIDKIENVDEKWLEYQIKQTKSDNENNQLGAFFEIIGLSMLIDPNYSVIPAKRNQTGYDAVIDFLNNGTTKLSLKKFSHSTHEKNIKRNFDGIRDEIVNNFSNSPYKIQIVIKSEYYPRPSEWEDLRLEIPKIAELYSDRYMLHTIGNWIVTLENLPPDNDESFAEDIFSYTFIGQVQYHKNEQQNFISKLEDASIDFVKYIPKVDRQSNALFVNLPETSSVVDLVSWTIEYFQDRRNTTIDSIIFYQPYVSTNISSDTSQISHYFRCINRDNSIYCNDCKVHTHVPVGIIDRNPPSWSLLINGKLEHRIDNSYIYQSGEHFIKFQRTEHGYSGNLRKKGPGIYTNLVLPMGKRATLTQRRFEDNLLII